jgi:hypothetical protein
MKKKSKYKPKPVRLDNMAWVTGGMLPVSTAKEAILNLGIKNHGALSCLVQGHGTRADAVMLRSAFITARALAMLDLGKEYKPDLDKAQVTIAELIARGDASGRYLFRGPEISIVNLGMEIHEAQMEVCTIAKLEDAVKLAKNVVSRLV